MEKLRKNIFLGARLHLTPPHIAVNLYMQGHGAGMLRIANGLSDIKFAPVGLGNEEIDSLWKIKLCPLPGGAEVEPAEKKPKAITKMSGV